MRLCIGQLILIQSLPEDQGVTNLKHLLLSITKNVSIKTIYDPPQHRSLIDAKHTYF